MAVEPYVPIAQLTAQQAIMTQLEVSTDDAEPYTNDMETAVTTCLNSKNTAVTLEQKNFNLFLFGGA